MGLVQAAGDWWLRRNRPLGREALVDYLTTLLWNGIAGIKETADVPGGLAHHAS